MIPGPEEFLRRLRWVLHNTRARPLLELHTKEPSTQALAESVRQRALAAPDFWTFFGTEDGVAELARVVRVLQVDTWPARIERPVFLAREICALLHA